MTSPNRSKARGLGAITLAGSKVAETDAVAVMQAAGVGFCTAWITAALDEYRLAFKRPHPLDGRVKGNNPK